MASDYGLNFGFRRSDESMAIREGRQKTPKTGTALLLGTAVEIDPANPGYLKQSAAAAAPVSDLRRLAERFELCASLVRNEYWVARGETDYIHDRRGT